MDAKEFFAFLASLIVSLGIIVTIVALGWFCVWKFFLCRFRLVRELLGTATENSTSNSNDSTSGEAIGSSAEEKSSPTTTKLNGRRAPSAGTYKSTRSRSRKED